MIEVWNHIPEFIEHDDKDHERTKCNSVEEVLQSPPIRHCFEGTLTIEHPTPNQLYFWSDGKEDFSTDNSMMNTLFVKHGGAYIGVVTMKADSAREFKEVLDALKVKFTKW